MHQSGQEWQRFPSWLQIAVVGLLIFGICLRFVNLDRKVYWVDETYTSLRVAGYTETEFVQQVFNGRELQVADLQKYQAPNPEKKLSDTLEALKGNAEHSPLYFMLARFWVEGLGYSVSGIRALSALISLLAFPCLYWLCLELFESALVGWIAVAIMAVSPLHVLYAQEARQYSLWTVVVLLSSALLLRSLRLKTNRPSWMLYAVSVSLGFYTHLLFGLVAIAHAIYVGLVERWRWGKNIANYLLASLAGCISFAPWLWIVITNLNQIQNTTASVTEHKSLSYLIDKWFLGLSRVLVGVELASANILVVILAVVAVYLLCRRAPKQAWWFVIALIGVNAIALLVPDLLLGGQRSTRVRYLIPAYVGVQLAIAYVFATQAIFVKTWSQKVWRVVMIGLVCVTISTGIASAQAQVWWNKSLPKTYYYPEVASILNGYPQPLMISDSLPINLLSFSYLLRPDTRLQLLAQPIPPQIPADAKDVFLFSPSEPLKQAFSQTPGYQVVPVYEEKEVVHLWKLERSPR